MTNVINFPDADWSDDEWREILEFLVSRAMVTWEDVAALTLGHLNPPQVGTQMASSEGFQQHYGKGSTMEAVLGWLYDQPGRCTDCGTRLELQHDHIRPKEAFENPQDADVLENITLRCRRCNVVRRKSHVFGGQTHLTAESALMWILFTYRPRSLHDYVHLCRLYGMTMASIRMQEGWAMAEWLEEDPRVAYEIDGRDPDRLSNILLWENDGAMTRCWAGEEFDTGAQLLHQDVSPDESIIFVAVGPHPSDDEKQRVTAYRKAVEKIPFSHYCEDNPQALAIRYVAPKRGTEPPTPAEFRPLPPRGMILLGSTLEAQPVECKVVLHHPSGGKNSITLGINSRRRKVSDIEKGEETDLWVEFFFQSPLSPDNAE